MHLALTFEDTASFQAQFAAAESFDAALGETIRVSTSDHAELLNRDLPDQHPIEAITGLTGTLGGKVSAADALTNLEIEALLGVI